MSLLIESFKLSNFRNHRSFELRDIENLTVFIGRNGVGKTNILEGIQLLSSATSFKHPLISQLIEEGFDFGRLECCMTDGSRQLDVKLTLSEGKRRYEINGKSKQIADMKGMIPTISFSRDDMQLVKGSSSKRRDALDAIGSQLAKNYYLIRQDYEKIVRQKNKLLKEDAPSLLIESADETLAMCGAQLFCYRVALLRRLAPFIEKNYSEISNQGESIGISYTPSWLYLDKKEEAPVLADDQEVKKDQIKALILENLEKFRVQERIRQRALVGPHNDKILIHISEKDATNYASQGQQRSAVLAWKMAEADLIIDMKETRPILLLDDVLSELDAVRREKLVSFVARSSQAFLTATDLSFFPQKLVEEARIVKLGENEGGVM